MALEEVIEATKKRMENSIHEASGDDRSRDVTSARSGDSWQAQASKRQAERRDEGNTCVVPRSSGTLSRGVR